MTFYPHRHSIFDVFEPLASLLQSIWPGFRQWLLTITPLDFVLIFWPLIIIDALRAIGKDVVLGIDWLRRRLAKNDVTGFVYPSLSILVPAHNEEKAIRRSIESSLAAVYPDKEIIVVYDGSTDGTYHLAKEYSDAVLIKFVHRDTWGARRQAR